MKIYKRRLINLLVLVILVAFFYAEENWRGKHAWENCKRELEAQGQPLDWNAYISPDVPGNQNFFEAPRMAEWFVGPSTFNELTAHLQNIETDSTITNKMAAVKYLAWSDQFTPDFDLIRQALKRPYARMEGNYSIGIKIPMQNEMTIRVLARTLAQRANCDLLLGQAGQALREETLLHDMGRILEGGPITIPAAMDNADILTGFYVRPIASGMQLHSWTQPQLVALQRQLAGINLEPIIAECLKEEPAALCQWCEINQSSKIFWNIKAVPFWPHGWIYQNMANIAMLYRKQLDCLDPGNNTISPGKVNKTKSDIDKSLAGRSPYKFLAVIAVPDFTKIFQISAYNQTLVNEAQIACALERYRFAHGSYPETLDVLVPQFIETVPHDLIGGQPLHYRRTDDGKFQLYSVGWNEQDDGGQPSPRNENGVTDYTKGDWVWPN